MSCYINNPYGHYFDYCPSCRCVMVICGKCGNNTCNGTYGKLKDGSKCDACSSAYDMDKENQENLPIVSNKKIRNGEPIINGTRFPVSQLLAELAEGHSISKIAEQYDMEEQVLANVLYYVGFFIDPIGLSTLDKWNKKPL